MRFSSVFPALLSAALLAGCVTPESNPPVDEPPAPKETKASAKAPAAEETKMTLTNLPPIPRGAGRLVVLRSSILGFAIQPIIRVNGKDIGRCTPGVARVIDLAPGNYDLTGETEVEESILVNLKRDETTYVKCSIGMGLVVGRLDYDVISKATALKNTGGMRIDKAN